MITKDITAWTDTVENFFANGENLYDIILAFAIFEHLHPDSDWVFKKIADRTQYVVSISNEHAVGVLHTNRNYEKVFSKYGFKQVFYLNCDHITRGFEARILKKEE